MVIRTPGQIYSEGIAYFRYLELKIDKNVFIPRPETELIVEKISQSFDNKNILDLCSGSGAIGLSIINEHNPLKVTFVEISPKVWPLLESNITKYDTKHISEIYKGSAIEFLETSSDKFDIILTNPPYIPTSWDNKLDIVDPYISLYSDTIPYQIIKESKSILNSAGELIIEHFDYDQDKIVSEFEKYGYSNIIKINDLAGKPRFVRGTNL